MDALTVFGLAAVTLMLVSYALEDRSPWFVLALRGRVRARLDLRLPSGCVAIRRRRGGVVGGRRPALGEDTLR